MGKIKVVVCIVWSVFSFSGLTFAQDFSEIELFEIFHLEASDKKLNILVNKTPVDPRLFQLKQYGHELYFITDMSDSPLEAPKEFQSERTVTVQEVLSGKVQFDAIFGLDGFNEFKQKHQEEVIAKSERGNPIFRNPLLLRGPKNEASSPSQWFIFTVGEAKVANGFMAISFRTTEAGLSWIQSQRRPASPSRPEDLAKQKESQEAAMMQMHPELKTTLYENVPSKVKYTRPDQRRYQDKGVELEFYLRDLVEYIVPRQSVTAEQLNGENVPVKLYQPHMLDGTLLWNRVPLNDRATIFKYLAKTQGREIINFKLNSWMYARNEGTFMGVRYKVGDVIPLVYLLDSLKIEQADIHETDKLKKYNEIEIKFRFGAELGLDAGRVRSEINQFTQIMDIWDYAIHVHILTNQPQLKNRFDAIRLYEFWRRIDLFSQMREVSRGGIVAEKMSFHIAGPVANRNALRALYNSLGKDGLKMELGIPLLGNPDMRIQSAVAFQSSSVYDQPGLMGFEFRMDSPYADYFAFLENAERHMLAEQWYLNEDGFKNWIRHFAIESMNRRGSSLIQGELGMSRNAELSASEQTTFIIEALTPHPSNELYQTLTQTEKDALRELAQKNLTVEWIYHDWSKDPMFFNDVASLKAIQGAQQEANVALKKVLDAPDLRLRRSIAIVNKFLLASGLLVHFSNSLNGKISEDLLKTIEKNSEDYRKRTWRQRTNNMPLEAKVLELGKLTFNHNAMHPDARLDSESDFDKQRGTHSHLPTSRTVRRILNEAEIAFIDLQNGRLFAPQKSSGRAYGFIDPITPVLWAGYKKLRDMLQPKLEEPARIELDKPFEGRKVLWVGTDAYERYREHQQESNTAARNNEASNKDARNGEQRNTEPAKGERPAPGSNAANNRDGNKAPRNLIDAERQWVEAVLKAMPEENKSRVLDLMGTDKSGSALYRAIQKLRKQAQKSELQIRGRGVNSLVQSEEFKAFRKAFHGEMEKMLKKSTVNFGKKQLFTITDYGLSSTLVQQIDFVLALYIRQVGILVAEGMSIEDAAKQAFSMVTDPNELQGLGAFVLTSSGISQTARFQVLKTLESSKALLSQEVISTYLKWVGRLGLFPAIAVQRAVTATGQRNDWARAFQKMVWPANRMLYAHDCLLYGYDFWVPGMLSWDMPVNPLILAEQQGELADEWREKSEQNNANHWWLDVTQSSTRDGRYIGMPQDLTYGASFNDAYSVYGALKLKMQLEHKDTLGVFWEELTEGNPVDIAVSGTILMTSIAVSHALLPQTPVLSTMLMLSIAASLESVWHSFRHRVESEGDIEDEIETWKDEHQRTKGRAGIQLRQAIIDNDEMLTIQFVKEHFEPELENALTYAYRRETAYQMRMAMVQVAWRKLLSLVIVNLRADLMNGHAIGDKLESLYNALKPIQNGNHSCAEQTIDQWPNLHKPLQKLFCAQKMLDAFEDMIMKELDVYTEDPESYCTEVHLYDSESYEDAIECALYKDYQARVGLWAKPKDENNELESQAGAFETRIPLQLVRQDLAFTRGSFLASIDAEYDVTMQRLILTDNLPQFVENVMTLVNGGGSPKRAIERLNTNSANHTPHTAEARIEDGRVLHISFPENLSVQKIRVTVWKYEEHEPIVDKRKKLDSNQISMDLRNELEPGRYYVSVYTKEQSETDLKRTAPPAYNFTLDVDN